ncbi:DUF1294 domain-containing protein [Enterococcus sp. LJL98]
MLSYLIVINLFSISLMYQDKQKALKKQWRIPEKTLFTVAFFGGSIGILLGGRLFHHKTNKRAFKYGIPFIIFFQILLSLSLFYYFT